jgi:hypothetical protein
VLYLCTRDQYYLFAKFGGFHGVTAALLVALRQTAPDEPVGGEASPFRALGLRNRHLSGAYVLTTLLLALSSGALHHHIGLYLFVLSGTYFGWLYLRFFQPVHVACGARAGPDADPAGGKQAAQGGPRGDPREEFSFASMWPPALQPAIERLSTPVFACCCAPAAGGADAHTCVARVGHARLLVRALLPAFCVCCCFAFSRVLCAALCFPVRTHAFSSLLQARAAVAHGAERLRRARGGALAAQRKRRERERQRGLCTRSGACSTHHTWRRRRRRRWRSGAPPRAGGSRHAPPRGTHVLRCGWHAAAAAEPRAAAADAGRAVAAGGAACRRRRRRLRNAVAARGRRGVMRLATQRIVQHTHTLTR